jgi:hypothetical protein
VEEVKNERESVDYYVRRKPELLANLDRVAQQWGAVLSSCYGEGAADEILLRAREEFEALLPLIPYIGGEQNPLTESLISSVQCLAFYRAMAAHGKTAKETGKVLYDAVRAHPEEYSPGIANSQRLSRDELMERRIERARRSQERRYAWDWVYEFVEGDGKSFDYGYNFTECATAKLYRSEGAGEFLPFYCFLDFPKCELGGLGLSRTTTLAEGGQKCDFRFKEGAKSTEEWPPPFLSEGRDSVN